MRGKMRGKDWENIERMKILQQDMLERQRIVTKLPTSTRIVLPIITAIALTWHFLKKNKKISSMCRKKFGEQSFWIHAELFQLMKFGTKTDDLF